METINTNGFSNEDAVQKSLNALKSNNEFKPPFVQYQSNTNPIYMAPRTTDSDIFSIPFTSVKRETTTSVFNAILPGCAPCVSSTPTQTVEQPTVHSVNQRLRRLSNRHRIAEKRAYCLLSRLNRLTQIPSTRPFFDGTVSDATESSSDEGEEVVPQQCHGNKVPQLPKKPKSLENWHQTRATIRSHWSLLQTEMVEAMDCLNTLKPLRNRCKKWRRSIPSLAQSGGLIESTSTDQVSSRTLTYEKTDKARHTYYDLNAINQIDFKFSGSAAPLQVSHPQCQQTCASGCVLCCPAFKPTASKTTIAPSVLKKDPLNITSRSIALDQINHSLLNGQERRPKSRSNVHSPAQQHSLSHRAFSSSMLMLHRKRPPPYSPHPQPLRGSSSGISSSASSSQDTLDPRHHQRPFQRHHFQQGSRYQRETNNSCSRYRQGIGSGTNLKKVCSYFSPLVTGSLYPETVTAASRKEPRIC